MLTELLYYTDCNIKHTFSNSIISFSVHLKHADDQKLFQISDSDGQEIACYDDIELAASAIEKLLR